MTRHSPHAQFLAMQPRQCASCGEIGHTVWSCPVETQKDRVVFAEAMFGAGARR